MARWNELPWRDDVYAAADIWKERCFLNDTALFNDKAVWTLDNIQALCIHLQNLQTQQMDYFDKLEIQMRGSSPAIIQLMAELMWFMRLIPIGKQLEVTHTKILASTKRENEERILS